MMQKKADEVAKVTLRQVADIFMGVGGLGN